MNNLILKYILLSAVGVFACIGIVFTVVFIGMQFGLLNVRGSISERNQFFATATSSVSRCSDSKVQSCSWTQTPEWSVIRAGLQKDQPIIDHVSSETGVSARMIAAVVVPEQVRFFTSEREIFKRYFEPMKILGSLSQFSLGVSGIKEETAIMIEQFANDSISPFYPGSSSASLLSYATSTSHDAALYNRLTDAKDHYYSYLYTALYIQEIEAQWHAAGYDISRNPAAVVTLFNIGFKRSNPNSSPQAGGAIITTGGNSYSYGELGEKFYDSNELSDVFPR